MVARADLEWYVMGGTEAGLEEIELGEGCACGGVYGQGGQRGEEDLSKPDAGTQWHTQASAGSWRRSPRECLVWASRRPGPANRRIGDSSRAGMPDTAVPRGQRCPIWQVRWMGHRRRGLAAARVGVG